MTLHTAAVLAAIGCSQAADPDASTQQGVRPISGNGSPKTKPAGETTSGVPGALAARIGELNACQSRLQETRRTFPVQDIQAESEGSPILYAFYNLDESGITNTFTTHVPGQNNECTLPANNAIGTVRGVIEPKPGAIVDPNDPRSLIDIFTDVCGLIVINNESGWYEGWIFHDVKVPEVAPAMPDGHAPFARITQADADLLVAKGTGQNVPGNLLTNDGRAPTTNLVSTGVGESQFPAFNRVSVPVSLGAWNTLQGEDGHAYWELNEYTNWSFPTYEVPTTGGIAQTFGQGLQYGPLGGLGPNADSRVPGSGPAGILNNNSVNGKVRFGDDPSFPRDADRFPEACGEGSLQSETRLRFLPSGLAREVLLDVFARPASFQSDVTNVTERFFSAYAFEVAKVDENKDGIVSFAEADIEDESDGQPNIRLYLAPNSFNRVAITREINDGLLAPRFAPSIAAYVIQGEGTFVDTSCPSDRADGGAKKRHKKGH
jgi:hypothetical protein